MRETPKFLQIERFMEATREAAQFLSSLWASMINVFYETVELNLTRSEPSTFIKELSWMCKLDGNLFQ